MVNSIITQVWVLSLRVPLKWCPFQWWSHLLFRFNMGHMSGKRQTAEGALIDKNQHIWLWVCLWWRVKMVSVLRHQEIALGVNYLSEVGLQEEMKTRTKEENKEKMVNRGSDTGKKKHLKALVKSGSLKQTLLKITLRIIFQTVLFMTKTLLCAEY